MSALSFLAQNGDPNTNSGNVAFSIDTFSEDEIKVYVNEVEKSNGGSNLHDYTIPDYTATGGTVTWNTTGNNTVPQTTDRIRIVRQTKILNNGGNAVQGKATYSAGAAVKATDLNNNTKQVLRALQEHNDQKIQTYDLQTAAVTGDKLAVDSVTSDKISDGTIVNADINASADISVSKLDHGTARQVLQTNSSGNGVEFTSNVDVPGTLDVTGATTLDSTLNVAGTTTAASIDASGNVGVDGNFDVNTNKFTVTASSGNTAIAGTLDVTGTIGTTGGLTSNNIRVGRTGGNEIDTSTGGLTIDSASGTTTVDDNLTVTGTLTAGSIDADTLESLGAGQFLRADASDTSTASIYTFDGASPSSTFNTAKLQGKDLVLRFGVGNTNNAASTMEVASRRGGIVDGQGVASALNQINLGHANLGLPGSSSEINSNVIGHVANINLGRMYMDMVGNGASTSSIIMRAAYPDGLMFYHPDTTMNNGRFTSGGALGTAGANNTYTENITDARNAADMRIITGGIVAKNRVEIGSSSVTGQLQISGDNVTATAAQLNVLNGIQASTNELNILDGVTADKDEINLLDGKSVVQTITGNANDNELPTAEAVNERIVELVTEVGGFVPIANETSFPTSNPDINDGAGTIVSLKALNSAFSTGSGVTTHTFTDGAGSGNDVTITGLPASTTFQAGKGLILETTTTLHTYTFHRLVLDESGVSNADALVTNFNEKYYGPLSSNPATRPSGANRQNGDLYFNTSDGKMKVYNGSHASGTWDDVAAPGNFFINTLSSSSGSGGGQSAFNNIATRFTLSNPPLTAQQLLVSVNGVIQKPNSGTSPSEGFAIDGADIIFASAPATNAPFFIVTIGSSVNIGTPSNGTVGADQIVNGSIADAEISSTAGILGTKISPDFGGQNVVTTGTITSGASTVNGNITIENDVPKITFNDNNSENDFSISNTNGTFVLHDNDANATRMSCTSSGQFTFATNVDFSGGIDVTGDITATGDATIGGGDLTVEGSTAIIHLTDTNNDDDFSIMNENGNFRIRDATNSLNRLNIDSSGTVNVTGNLDVGAGVDVTGAITATGTGTFTGGLLEVTGTQPVIKLTDTDNNDDFSIINNHGNYLIYDATDGVYRFNIDSSGNVGIGTGSDAADRKLHVKSSGLISKFESTSSTAAIMFATPTNESANTIPNIGATDNDLTFTTGNLSRVTVKSDGKVGIGTATPNGALHIHYGTDPALNLFSTQHTQNTGSKINFGVGQGASSGGNTATRIESNIPSAGGAMTGELIFYTNPGDTLTERVKMHSNGNLEVIDGNIIVASGHGISFSATSDASGAQSELLDDYEEGTWTPSVVTGTASFTGAIYTKIGRFVYFQGKVGDFSDRSSGNSIVLSGLPYTPTASLDSVVGATMLRYSSNTDICATYMTGAGQLQFYGAHSGDFDVLLHSDLTQNASFIYFHGSYMI